MNRLLLLAFLCDLLLPIVIAQKFLPPASRFASHVVFLALIGINAAIVLRCGRFPKWVSVLLAISTYGCLISCLNRQDILSTVWGLYLWIKYPMLCLYAYLRPWHDPRVSRYLRQACWWILAAEVCVQVGQYLSGVIPGDNLAGTLTSGSGDGTGCLTILLMWVLAMSLGVWIVRGSVLGLTGSIALCSVSAVLGESKFFFFGMISSLVIAGLLRMRASGHLRWLAILVGLVMATGVTFVWSYNAFVPAAQDEKFQKLLSKRALADYNFAEFDIKSPEAGHRAANLGRLAAVRLGWSYINTSAPSLLFGNGLGSQSESEALGTSGIMLKGSRWGTWSGPSLVILTVELGLIGIATVLAFCAWTGATLSKASRVPMESNLAVLINALLIFTVQLPLWLWYTSIWARAGAMFLYFFTLGYALQRVEQCRQVVRPFRGRAIMGGSYAQGIHGRDFAATGSATTPD